MDINIPRGLYIHIIIRNMNLQYTIRNVATGNVLDSNHAGAVYSLPYNQGKFQKWNIVYLATNWVNIKNVATGRYLDTSLQGSPGM